MRRRARCAFRGLTALLLASLAAPAWTAPARPALCSQVAPGDSLRRLVAEAAPGSVFCLSPGIHQGPLRVEGPIAIWGEETAVLRSPGSGSTLEVEGEGALLQGFTIDGSGGRFDLLDAALRIRADRVRVVGLRIRNALFGILAEQCRDLVLLDNEIGGQPAKALGMRGDAIRLWEVEGAWVEGNRIADSRDVVVWYSRGNHFRGNRVSGGRYGTHFMYSHDNRVEQSAFVGNVVGVFAMYSRGLLLRGNLISQSRGAAGVGIGAKESGDLVVEDNWLVANSVGIYLDNSPLQRDESNRFEGNALRFGDVGVVFHGPAARNHFLGNRFASQREPVRVEGGGSAMDARWRGNDFDDYAGYDFDGDSVGDIPYQLRDLSADWVARAPALRFFRGTPAMGLVAWIGRVLPLFQPITLLEDPVPAMRLDDPPPPPGVSDAG